MSQVFDKIYVLIINANEHPELGNLPDFSEYINKVEDWMNRLEMGSSDMQILQGKKATRNNVMEAIKDLADKLKNDRQAKGQLIISGGLRYDGNKIYLITYDLILDELEDTSVEGAEIAKLLAAIEPDQLKRDLPPELEDRVDGIDPSTISGAFKDHIKKKRKPKK